MSFDKLRAGFGDVSKVTNADQIIAAGLYDGLPRETIQLYIDHARKSQPASDTSRPAAEPHEPEPMR